MDCGRIDGPDGPEIHGPRTEVCRTCSAVPVASFLLGASFP